MLTTIHDSTEVKSALSSWASSHTAASEAETKKLQGKDAAASASSIQHSGLPLLTSSDVPASIPPTPQPTTALKLPFASPPPTKTETRALDEPTFETSKAITLVSGAEIADVAVQDRRRSERDEWVLGTYLRRPSSLGDGQPLFQSPTEEGEVRDLINGLSNGQAHFFGELSSKVLAGPPTATHYHPNVAVASSSSPTAAKAAQSSAERVTCILPKLPHSVDGSIPTPAPVPPRPHRPSRKPPGDRTLANGVRDSSVVGEDGEQPRPLRRKAVEQLKRNVGSMKRMRKLKSKFDLLDYCLENDEPMPSGLLVDSDEEDEEMKRGAGKAAQSPDQDEKTTRALHLNGVTPVSPLAAASCEGVRSTLRERIVLMLGNAGFSTAQMRPTDVLTNVAERFMSSLGRTLRMYTDQYGSTMTSEEIILHTLHATSTAGVKELDKYLYEDQPRAQSRLDELKRKLEASWKERVAVGEERLVSEEDARYFGEESDDLVAGNLPSALDDDFFGFKALGLDEELGMSNLSVPSRLMRPRALRARAGLAQVKEEQEDAYQRPQPFIRITEAAIPAQIGLLQTFYRELLQRRGYRVGEGGAVNGDSTNAPEGEHAPPPQAQMDADEGEVEGMLIVGDDDPQARTTRYKLPPNGKLPKQEFWSANPLPTSSTTAAAPSNATQTSGSKGSGTKGAKGATGGKAVVAAASKAAGAGGKKKAGKKGSGAS